MADRREIDRAAWAEVVSELLREEVDTYGEHGAQSRLARRVDVSPNTIQRWREQKVTVATDNVNAVAEATGRSPIDLLVRVGYYTPEDVQERREHVLSIMDYAADELSALSEQPRFDDPLEGRLWHALAAVGLPEEERLAVLAYLRARAEIRRGG